MTKQPRYNSLAARRAKYESVKPIEPENIILAVRLDNGDFEATVRVPLTEAENFDNYVARWLKLCHSALQAGVESLSADLTKKGQP